MLSPGRRATGKSGTLYGFPMVNRNQVGFVSGIYDSKYFATAWHFKFQYRFRKYPFNKTEPTID